MVLTGAKWIAVVAVMVAGIARPPAALGQAEQVARVALSAGPATRVPFGWADFCRRYAGECDGPALPPVVIKLDGAALRRITAINRAVNDAVEPVSDPEHWGVLDQWDYPTDGKGDCEDYALLKRKELMDAGFPRQALLMTVVRDRLNEGHAILTVRTSEGDFVLDNLDDDVRLWSQTGYRFVKRQAQDDPNVWVSLGDPEPAPAFTAGR